MSEFWWAASMFVLGVVVGIVIAVVVQEAAAAKASRERATRRAVEGWPDRDAPQRGARGTAVVHQGEYRERDWSSLDDDDQVG